MDDVISIYQTIDNERKYLGEWLPFIEFTREVSDTHQFVEMAINNIDKDLTCAIYYQNKFAGLTGFKDTDFTNKRTEIGYWLSEQFQGKGIVTKACRSLINYTFDELKLNRIQLRAAEGNKKSQLVAERLGFKQEGVQRNSEYHVRGFLNMIVFSLLKEERTW